MSIPHTGAPDAGPLGSSEEGHIGAFASYSNPPSIWPDFLVGQAQAPVRVMVVDDDAHMRTVIAQELMADPRTLLVAQAGSLREARRLVRQQEVDVLLVDLNLCDGSGLELIRYAKTVRPSVEIIVISVMDTEQEAIRAFELGATGYLVKNSWFGNFAQAVLQVANGGASITPGLARRLLHSFDRVRADGGARGMEGEKLSDREKEVLRMVANGYVSAEIGQRLAISSMTVNTHIRNIYRKLHVRTRAQAVSFASLWGLL
ncbi:MAG: DNA-binding response regulator [Burkholderiales bacterium 68-12]|nr:MAG: DNA-binding response regulator [Burkholderiales bacterium 68-12]